MPVSILPAFQEWLSLAAVGVVELLGHGGWTFWKKNPWLKGADLDRSLQILKVFPVFVADIRCNVICHPTILL